MWERKLEANNFKILQEQIPEYKEWREEQEKYIKNIRNQFTIQNSETGQVLGIITNIFKEATKEYNPNFNKKQLSRYIKIVDDKQFQNNI